MSKEAKKKSPPPIMRSPKGQKNKKDPRPKARPADTWDDKQPGKENFQYQKAVQRMLDKGKSDKEIINSLVNKWRFNKSDAQKELKRIKGFKAASSYSCDDEVCTLEDEWFSDKEAKHPKGKMTEEEKKKLFEENPKFKEMNEEYGDVVKKKHNKEAVSLESAWFKHNKEASVDIKQINKDLKSMGYTTNLKGRVITVKSSKDKLGFWFQKRWSMNLTEYEHECLQIASDLAYDLGKAFEKKYPGQKIWVAPTKEWNENGYAIAFVRLP